MVNTVHSASSALVAFGFESTFGGGATKTKLFGKDQKCNNLEWTNGQQPLGQVYTPEVTDFLYQKNHGGCTMEYVLSNPFVLSFIFGAPTTPAPSAGVYTHTWSSNPSVNSAIRDVYSANMEIWMDGKTAGVDRNAKGVICPSFTMKTGIDKPIDISQTLEWGIEDAVGTTLVATPPTETNFTPYGFVHASIKLPVSGGTIAAVQDIDVTFDTGAELVYNINASGNAYNAYRKMLNMTGKMSLAVLDNTNMARVQARTEVADLKVKFTNGLSGTSERTITFTFEGIGLSRLGTSGISAGEMLLEDFSFQCRRCTAVAINASAS